MARVDAARVAKGIGKQEACKRAGLQASAWSALLKCECSYETAAKLALQVDYPPPPPDGVERPVDAALRVFAAVAALRDLGRTDDLNEIAATVEAALASAQRLIALRRH